MLKKKNLFTIIIILFFIFLIFNLTYKKDTKKNKDVATIVYNGNKDYTLLKEMHTENDKYTFFSFDTIYDIFNNNIHYYNVAWLFSMKDICDIDYPKELINAARLNIEQVNDIKLQDKNLFNILNMVQIEKKVFNEVKNKEYYINKLLERYISDEGLFYIKNRDEDQDSKIIATNIALQIFDYIGYLPEDLLYDIEHSMINLFLNDKNFTFKKEQLKKNVFDRGLIIIDNLRILDKYSIKDIKKDIYKRKKWILFWYEEFNNYINQENITNLIGNLGIINFYNIFSYLNINYKFNENFIKQYEDIDLIRKSFLSNPQATYQMLKIFKIYDKKISNEIVNIIEDNMEYVFYENQPSTNILNMYYGIKLSNILKFEYNKEKALAYIKNYLKVNGGSMIDIYYIYLIYNDMECKNFEYENLVKDALSNTLETMDLNDINFFDAYCVIYFNKIYNFQLSNKYDRLIERLNYGYITTKIKSINNEKDFYYIVLLADMLNIKIESELLTKSIFEFYDIEGCFVISKDNRVGNIYSTYRMLNLLDKFKIKISKEQKENIDSYLKRLKGINGGYFIMVDNSDDKYIENYKTNFTIQSFYCGIYSSNILNNILIKGTR
ncbi:hypothetical protein [Paramaledivibacter caminithermalis]|jgi:hypothetical protein|uniref:Uncharacterized protein n=1 Tax=Paramaledivibacter caminithermalis (strain DSM 15212 / CIP 107654 / DViRD3) TaxID=1121301 RepID=A0A1M6TPM6_PARC5|nr:hypothetical protein [Paramaledivibacter caminithermalis]SHK58935.1 hypothetical protein SAMN02745912_03752 [Paramaledivibacter caminithermalis DSM 15212]